jgi:hypothetical protein
MKATTIVPPLKQQSLDKMNRSSELRQSIRNLRRNLRSASSTQTPVVETVNTARTASALRSFIASTVNAMSEISEQVVSAHVT